MVVALQTGVAPAIEHVESKRENQSDRYIAMEDQFGCHNYHPLPVVLKSAQGCKAVDVDGKEYFDFLSAYSSLNQGHLHPRIIQAARQQLDRLTVTSRAFHNDQLGPAEKMICETFRYDKCLFMNTGVEAVESAIKLARRWGYEAKGIPKNEALLVTASGNFHGRTISVISFSDDPSSYGGYGPYTPGFLTVEYGSIAAMKDVLEKHGQQICAVLLEPIQGEAGVVMPPPGYLCAVSELCKQHNVLFMLDEIQTGLGRTGDLLCHYYNESEPSNQSAYSCSEYRPDVVLLAKALGGGVYPVSCVLADDHVMLKIRPGEHGSTYGGNPMACAVAMASLSVILDDKLSEQSKAKGVHFGQGLRRIQKNYPEVIECVRGRGMLWGVVVRQHNKFTAWDLCTNLKELGLLSKTTHEHIIRFSPPLVITLQELDIALGMIESAVRRLREL